MYQSQFPRLPVNNLPTMYDLPSEDPEEMGLPDLFHDSQPDLLSETCRPDRYSSTDFFVAADLNLYYDLNHLQWHKRPDWFMAIGVPSATRQEDLRWSYVMWQEKVSPLVIVELLSPGTEDEDLGRNLREIGKPPTKWEVYERILKVPFYVVYDRYDNELRIFQIVNGKYQRTALNPAQPRFWIEKLGLGLGLWRGSYQGAEGKWLRWYGPDGEWIPTDSEAKQVAESARDAAESARDAAESARDAAESARDAAESARDTVETQLQTAIIQLQSLGITPEQIATTLGMTVEKVDRILGIEN